MPRRKVGASRPISEAQRAHLERLAEQNRMAHEAPPSSGLTQPASAVMERPAEGEHLPASDNLLQEFASFADILGRAGAKKQQRDAAVDGIEKLLNDLTPGDYPELAEHPVVQRFLGLIEERKADKGERVPGRESGEGLARRDEPWRMEDVLKRANDPTHPDHETFQLVQWPGRETVYLGWNGLSIWVFEDLPMLIPKVFMDVYNESRKQKQAAKQHADFIFAKRGLTGGSGPEGVPADPTIMAGPNGVQSRMLRGAFSGGEFTPGKGLEIDVPDADRPGIGEGAEEGEAAGAAA